MPRFLYSQRGAIAFGLLILALLLDICWFFFHMTHR